MRSFGSFLVISSAIISLCSCLKIESDNEKQVFSANYALEAPEERKAVDLRFDYGLLNNQESRLLEQLRASYIKKPDSLLLGERLGKFLYEKQQYSSATAIFEDLAYLDPLNVLYNRFLGQSYLSIGETSRAIYFLNKASIFLNDTVVVRDDFDIKYAQPKHNYHTLPFNVWYLLGLAHYSKRNYDKAITCFANAKRVAHVINLKVMSNNFLYMSYRRAGNDERANEVLREVASIRSIKSARVHLKSLEIYQKKSDPNKIAKGVKKRYFSEEDFAILLYCIGNYHILNHDFAAARIVFKRVLNEAGPYTRGYILAMSDLEILEENLLN